MGSGERVELGIDSRMTRKIFGTSPTKNWIILGINFGESHALTATDIDPLDVLSPKDRPFGLCFYPLPWWSRLVGHCWLVPLRRVSHQGKWIDAVDLYLGTIVSHELK